MAKMTKDEIVAHISSIKKYKDLSKFLKINKLHGEIVDELLVVKYKKTDEQLGRFNVTFNKKGKLNGLSLFDMSEPKKSKKTKDVAEEVEPKKVKKSKKVKKAKDVIEEVKPKKPKPPKKVKKSKKAEEVKVEPTDLTGIKLADVIPLRKNNRTALIDADTQIYIGALQAVTASFPYDKKKMKKLKKEYKLVLADKGLNIIECFTKEALANAKSTLEATLDEIVSVVNGDENVKPIIAITRGENFRYSIYPDYKLNRAGTHSPTLINVLQEHLIASDKYKVVFDHQLEADDIVCTLKRKHSAKYNLVSMDKDVLNSCAGKHFNPYYANPRFVDIKPSEANKFKYIQCLMGDSADGIKGCQGIGEKSKKLVEIMEAKTEAECWKITLDTYKEQAGKASVKAQMAQLEEDGQKPKLSDITPVIDDRAVLEEAILNLNLVDMTMGEINLVTGEMMIRLWKASGDSNKVKESRSKPTVKTTLEVV